MPGNLTKYLQQEFPSYLPSGWHCFPERRLLHGDLENLLGYKPTADLLLEHGAGGQRIWIEFEVSRADPVANHAKFASSRLFCPSLKDDAFVSMVSSHVARGRRNIASSAIFILRNVGMLAFQTILFPEYQPEEIKRLNHLALPDIGTQGLNVGAECQRALAITKPLVVRDGHRIHFASDPFEIMVNIERWNREVAEEYGRQLWGRRRGRYFAFNPATSRFAPSKFCAFIPVCPSREAGKYQEGPDTMTIGLYCNLDESETRFDGNIAWRHLTERLGFQVLSLKDDTRMAGLFEAWLNTYEHLINLNPRDPVILSPPKWFLG